MPKNIKCITYHLLYKERRDARHIKIKKGLYINYKLYHTREYYINIRSVKNKNVGYIMHRVRTQIMKCIICQTHIGGSEYGMTIHRNKNQVITEAVG